MTDKSSKDGNSDSKDENSSKNPEITENLKTFRLLPLRDIVVFEHMTTTILAGRQKSIGAIEQAKETKSQILAATQTNPDHDNISKKNIRKTGDLQHN